MVSGVGNQKKDFLKYVNRKRIICKFGLLLDEDGHFPSAQCTAACFTDKSVQVCKLQCKVILCFTVFCYFLFT